MPLMSGDRVRTPMGGSKSCSATAARSTSMARTTVDVQSDDLLRLIDGRIARHRWAFPRGGLPDRLARRRREHQSSWRLSPVDAARRARNTAGARGPSGLRRHFYIPGTTPVGRVSVPTRARPRPSFTYVFNSAAWDDFDQWTEARRNQQISVSAQYLPAEVQSYSSGLDKKATGATTSRTATSGIRGSPPDGVPTITAAGCHILATAGPGSATIDSGGRPITMAAGASPPARGSGFLARDGHPLTSRGRHAPGYVSWCPLGFDNRAVFALNVSIGRPYLLVVLLAVELLDGRGRAPFRLRLREPAGHSRGPGVRGAEPAGLRVATRRRQVTAALPFLGGPPRSIGRAQEASRHRAAAGSGRTRRPERATTTSFATEIAPITRCRVVRPSRCRRRADNRAGASGEAQRRLWNGRARASREAVGHRRRIRVARPSSLRRQPSRSGTRRMARFDARRQTRPMAQSRVSARCAIHVRRTSRRPRRTLSVSRGA